MTDPITPPVGGEETLEGLSMPRPIAWAGAPRSSAQEGPGAVIGRYTLIEEIGAGGFGAVFLAEQSEPVARRVALKILKLGMDTQQVIARFEQERQALALMDHPHIAKVLDAGTTDAGRPYFVMELVAGEPITKFCDATRLAIRERLELMIQVCNAIQHAHQKGIIHRDIKPSNVLVSMHDGVPRARVIDFGIAKAIEQPLTGETMHTQLGQFMGTPLYMSPEQSEGSLDIDTRSDVYSLGVLLYELLTGVTPFDAATFQGSPVSELQRLIREVDPLRPSARLSTSTQTLPQLAARRSTEPRKLTSLLRGELDWIAMKAIEKEPERRYQTANALALDLQHYLAGEPVVAAPPSARYRFRKFVVRHKGPVIAAAIVALALVGGLAGTLWQARVAATQRDAAATQRDAARQEAARATALNDFMTQMLTASDPEAHGSRDVTVRELLAKASATATKTLAGQPQAEAEARTLLGNTFLSLGRNDEAKAELERAVALRAGSVGSDRVTQAESLYYLASVERKRGDFQSAVSLHEQARDLFAAFGDERLEELARTYLELGASRIGLSQYAEAEQDLDRSDRLFDRLPGEHPASRAGILAWRAVLAQDWKGDLEEAERLFTAALAFRRQADEPNLVAVGLNDLAMIKMNRGELDEAIPLYEEAIAVGREVYGDRHPEVAARLENLANVYMKRKEYDDAIALLEQVLSIRESVFGADSFPVARTRFNMGVVANQSGGFERALGLIDAALPVFREHSGEQSLEAASGLLARGRSHEGLADFASAQRDYESALAMVDVLGAPGAATRLNALLHLARLQCKQGSTDRARGTVDLALAALDRENPDHQAWFTKFEDQLASCDSAR